jgi:spore coat polysaccharide biosynthesis protein SpsF
MHSSYNIKVGILIIARMGSTRLKDKHLLNIKNEPLIGYLIKRIKKEFDNFIGDNYSLFICTGDKSLNYQFENVAKKNNISVFYGNNNNIPLRMLECCNANNLDFMISIDGDDILCATEGMRKVYKELAKGEKFIKTKGFPFGMNSLGLSSDFLKKSLKGHSNKSLETGWGWIFDSNECKDINFDDYDDTRLRFTLDYADDLKFFDQIISDHEFDINLPTKTIIGIALKNDYYKINFSIHKEYWKNFYKHQSLEKKE